MINKEHLTDEGLRKFVNIRASFGKGISDELKKEFSNIVPLDKPLIKTDAINNYWLAGFVVTEGCFECVIRKCKTAKTGFQVAVRFTLIQHSRDTFLFNVIQKHLNCGVVRVDSHKPQVVYSVSDFPSIFNIIIPFFDKYLIHGAKSADYADFRKIAFLMGDKVHLTTEGLKKIKEIKAQMNSKIVHSVNTN